MKTTYGALWLIVILLLSCNKENGSDNYGSDNVLGQTELSNVSFANKPVHSIAVDAYGAKWIGTDQGLFLLKDSKSYTFTYFKDKKISSLIKSENKILISTSLGAYTILTESNSNSLVDSLYKTETGGTDNFFSVYGLDIFKKEWLGSPEGLAHSNGTTWKWNDDIWNNLGGVTDVRSMAFREKDCFFGTYGNFLYHVYYEKNGNVDAVTGASQMLGGAHNPVNNYNGELTTDTIFCLFASSDGSIWFGSKTGLTRNIGGTNPHFEDGTFEYFLRGERVHSTIETSDKKMWAGTENGVYVKNGSEWANYNTSGGIPGNRVYTIAEDTDLSIWIGTNNGISHFANNKWTNF
jgi:ligand-binding sensor domain-containing protein